MHQYNDSTCTDKWLTKCILNTVPQSQLETLSVSFEIKQVLKRLNSVLKDDSEPSTPGVGVLFQEGKNWHNT